MLPDYIKLSEELNRKVFAFSVNDRFVLEKYKKKYGLDIPMISDFNGELTRFLGLELDSKAYFSYCCRRALILVDESVVVGVSLE